MSKKTVIVFSLSLALGSALVMPVRVDAQVDPRSTNYGLSDPGFQKVGIGQTRDLKDTLAQIINIVLGFLGIIAVIIIMIGGFKWMTAAGNEEQVSQARKMIVQGVIGLVIIFTAWAIAAFVINQLSTATQ